MTTKAYLLLFFPLCLLFSNDLAAQIEDLTQDKSFFNQQKILYQRWLDHTGLGDFLQVRELEVKEDELTLFLEIPLVGIDSIVQAWHFVKTEFELHHPITLEQQLFYKMVSLMEVRQSVARVAIFDTYDLRKEPLFLRGIYFEDGGIQVVENNPKSKIREIHFTSVEWQSQRKWVTQSQMKLAYDKAVVFERIYKFVEAYFEQSTCQNRNPEVRLLESRAVLRFEAIDLCRVVLTDAANPLLCQFLHEIGLDCNWVKREKLDFTIAYQEQPEGFSLHITLDGKYGSGLYDKVGRGGYYSMEIDFDEYLENYADRFQECLRCWLLTGEQDCCQ